MNRRMRNRGEVQMVDGQKHEVALLQGATVNYPVRFETALQVKNGLLLKDGTDKYYLLKKFPGNERELAVSLEAESFLRQRGFRGTVPGIVFSHGGEGLEHGRQSLYLKYWHPEVEALPYRWQTQFACETLAQIHLSGEGFHPGSGEGWNWPDWVKLFEMARDAIYELHTTVVLRANERLLKYFDRTAKEAICAIEEAIVHLKAAGYYELRAAGMRHGYVNLSRAPSLAPGGCFDLIGKIAPDLPACGLGAFLGQMGDWSKLQVINDVLDLLETYGKIRPLSTDEVALVKGFVKFPWQFWWATEQYFELEEESKRLKRYKKALKSVYGGVSQEIRAALQEF